MNFILDPGLVFYLPLHELDGSSFVSRDACGHLCTVTGASWRPYGRYFDGTDDVIQFPYSGVSFAGATAFTICAWVRWNGGNSGNHKDIVHLGSYEVILNNWSDQTWAIYFHNGTSPYEDHISASGDADSWVFLTGVYDGSALTLYRNAVSSGSPISVPTPVRSNPSTTNGIGRYGDSGARQFPGDIGEVKIYNRALNILEIQQNYLATKRRYQ